MDNNSPETVYYYIADVNPSGAEAVLSKYGVYMQDGSVPPTDTLAQGMYELVQTDGEPALIDIMSIHPDKSMILELFGNQTCCTTNCSGGCCTKKANCSKTSISTCVPPLPLGSNAGRYNCCTSNKPFFSSPTNCLLVGVAVIAVLAVLKS